MVKKTMLAAALVIGGVTGAWAQNGAAPFGIAMGTPKSQLGPVTDASVSEQMFKLPTVPRPHPDLESYIVQATPRTGVCFVKGVGKTFQTSVYGSEVQKHFNDLKEQLEAVYGPSKVYDTLMPGSIWNEPKDFMMGMVKKERFLAASWNRDTKHALPASLQEIGVVATALSTNSAYVSVEFYGTNTAACEADVKAGKQNAFK